MIPKNFDEMVLAMLNTEQMPGQSVYQHGAAVAENINVLLSYLRTGSELPEASWRIPTWFKDYSADLLANVHSEETRHLYALYHDCGKPYCLIVDSEGHRHFPDHANVSKRVWEAVGGNPAVGKLISQDMVLHTATSDEISLKLRQEWSREDSVTLLIASLAEIHVNARMISNGGIESVGFKMKWKAIDKRGRQVCKHWFVVDK